MAKGPCKCKKGEECEECPEWIFTFADLVMLMMGFFVILWVLKPNPGKDGKTDAASETEWLKVVGEIRGAFGYDPAPNSTDPVDQAILKQRVTRGKKQGAESEVPRDGSTGTDHLTTSIRQGKVSTVGGRLMFEAGDAKLLPQTTRALDQIAEMIRGHYNIVVVKGHASLDDLLDGASPQQQMDLSLRRAQAAADYLISRGVQPDILRVQGCSTFEPVKQQTYTPEAQAQNRRVEVEATATLLEERQDHTRAAQIPSPVAARSKLSSDAGVKSLPQEPTEPEKN